MLCFPVAIRRYLGGQQTVAAFTPDMQPVVTRWLPAMLRAA